MKSIQDWLNEYAISHQNPTNKFIHWLCVPAIVFSLILMLHSIPIPPFFPESNLNWAWIVSAFALFWYFRQSVNLGIGMLLILTGLNYLAQYFAISLNTPLWKIGAGIFVLAWIGQFFGHHIEGKKPSFLKDLQFLLIGPVWLLHFIYRKWNIPY